MAKPKMQATLDGYLGWAFDRLVEKTGEKNAEVCKWVLRDWLQDKAEFLEGEFGVSRQAWEQATSGNVAKGSFGRQS